MSLQINAALTTKDGGSVSSGGHVKFEVYLEGFVGSGNVDIII